MNDELTMSLGHAFRAASGSRIESCVVQLLDKQRVRTRARDPAAIEMKDDEAKLGGGDEYHNADTIVY